MKDCPRKDGRNTVEKSVELEKKIDYNTHSVSWATHEQHVHKHDDNGFVKAGNLIQLEVNRILG